MKKNLSIVDVEFIGRLRRVEVEEGKNNNYVATDEFFNSFSPVGWKSGIYWFKKGDKKGRRWREWTRRALYSCGVYFSMYIYNGEKKKKEEMCVIKHSQAQTHKFCSWCCPKKEIPLGVVERFTPCDILSRYYIAKRVLLLLLETDRDTYACTQRVTIGNNRETFFFFFSLFF